MRKLDDLYKLARRAAETNNIDMAQSYYNAILLEDPESWEATLNATFYSARDYDLDNLDALGEGMINCIKIVMKQIKKQEPYPLYENAIAHVVDRCDRISRMICEEAERYYNMKAARYTDYTPLKNMSLDREERIKSHLAAVNIMYTLGDYIEHYFGTDKEICFKEASTAWQCAIERHAKIVPQFCDRSDKENARAVIAKYDEKVKKYYPSYVSPKTSGCYVATAIYGCYDCPEVWTLRRYRDTILSKTAFGRAFISAYYLVSPKLVELFGQKKWFSKLLKTPLDRFVKKLNSAGVESSPYKDRD